MPVRMLPMMIYGRGSILCLCVTLGGRMKVLVPSECAPIDMWLEIVIFETYAGQIDLAEVSCRTLWAA
jgi:hypothetical protein